MFLRSACRTAARGASKAAAGAAAATPTANANSMHGNIPSCLTHHGHEWAFHFLNHPGVMAVSTLLEMRGVTRVRANFTQENIEALKEYDLDLARQAQIAFDNKISINFLDLERIEQNLPKLLKERDQLEEARKEILGRKPGDYTPLKSNTADCKIETFKLQMPDSYRNLLDK